MAEGLKSRLEQAAAANNRSLTAEIASRLEASFSLAMDQFQDAAKGETLALQRDLETLVLRQKLIMSRGDAMKTRADLATLRYEKALREAKTDADFERAKAEIGELDQLHEESTALAAEMEKVLAEREALIARADSIQRTLKEAEEILEERIRKGMARRALRSSGDAKAKPDAS